MPTPPDTPNIKTFECLADLNSKFPVIYNADQAVIAAYKTEQDSTGVKCFGLRHNYLKVILCYKFQ